MKKTVKYLRIQNLKMQLQQKHPKEVSRAVMCFKDNQGNVYKTGKYGEVTPQTIIWQDAIQILYTNQQMFKLETVCQHEYGYDIQELQAMYNGQLYIKTENFFRPLTIHVFNSEGTKCGILRYLIKVIEKQVAKTAKKQQIAEQQPTVKVDLIGKITLYAASVNISSPAFKKDKYANQFLLTVQICGQKFTATYKKNYEWSFQGSKVQIMENSPDDVRIQLLQYQEKILYGQTNMGIIMENKRFVTHSINLYNPNQQKVGTLKLDLRFITKQQILDLMYSPTKLTKNKDQNNKNQQTNQHNFQAKKYNMQSSRLSKARANSSLLQTTRKKQKLHSALSQNILETEAMSRAANRYKKVHVNNSYNQIIFSRSKRFSQPKNVNPYVSYNDPYKLSDFSPDNKNGYTHSKGPDISLTKKSDFTKPYKGNPGVGQYRLPSIWDKY